ncbi:hypothetical protein ARMSODRAFT_104846 [Armillaria solidipes]|uniref:Uncharacterized protein n=1 Tax=Armillaria solidipes TaxID=1076256 RepID=A0A2H3ALP2_9AGAR|nr:hypothetical protein ARMSODRAFT_104846 [Armillaria solidipes]
MIKTMIQPHLSPTITLSSRTVAFVLRIDCVKSPADAPLSSNLNRYHSPCVRARSKSHHYCPQCRFSIHNNRPSLLQIECYCRSARHHQKIDARS